MSHAAETAAIFLPWGGSRRPRHELVRGLRVWPGERVLDLGCGTGLVTQQLVHEGAVVTGIDRLPGMLEGARRRAPQARLMLRGRMWRRFLARLEPSPSVPEILDGALDDEVADAGVHVVDRRDPCGGRVQLLVLRSRRVGP